MAGRCITPSRQGASGSSSSWEVVVCWGMGVEQVLAI
jgi:hypothetical protein